MLLTIDVGNTNTVLGIFDEDEILQSWRVKTDTRDTADELWIKYRSLIEDYEIDGISLCSTVPAVLRELRTMLARHYSNTPSTILEPGIKTGVPLLVDNPKEIGSDRIANTLAAHTLFGDGGAVIVVDFGTSTNLDVVSVKENSSVVRSLQVSKFQLMRSHLALLNFVKLNWLNPVHPLERTPLRRCSRGLSMALLDKLMV